MNAGENSALEGLMLIGGEWREGASGRVIEVTDPATEQPIGRIAAADPSDLDAALAAAAEGFERWRATPAHERAAILRRGCETVRAEAGRIARILSAEEGKPVAEAEGEIRASIDNLEWMAEEATRAYGRLLTPRRPGHRQEVRHQPIGPVAAFTPWNFPALTPLRKMAGALAAGCSLILKPSEETPFTAIELARAFTEAGLPKGALNLVFGDPAAVSERLIASEIVRKISFTGSTAVGKLLLAQAAQGVKRATMELGGHAPAIVCDDVDPVSAARLAVAAKFRNAGQVCTCPSRFYVARAVYEPFVAAFVEATRAIAVARGDAPGAQMGPLANARRRMAVESFVEDAQERGARLAAGGERLGDRGYFYAPTVLTEVPDDARIMREEPFGPMAPIQAFDSLEEAIAKANGTPYGLAAYGMTRSLARAEALSEGLAAGMVVINHFTVSTPYSPFGGVRESGDGLEGGVEGLLAYMTSKTVSTRTVGDDLT